MKKILLISIIVIGSLPIYSQAETQVNQYWYDHIRVNPGSAGNKDMVCISGILSDNQMFQGFPGGPRSVILNANAPFNLFGAKHGVGISIMQDAIGFFTDTKVSLSYAYRQPMGDGHLGIGIAGELQENKITPQWQGTEDYDPASDPAIPQTESNGMGFNLSTGIFYRSEDIYFGISAKNIFSPKTIEYKTSGESTSSTIGTNGSDAVLLLTPHYTATAGYTLQMNNPSFEYTPSVFIKYEGGSPISIDFNNLVTYNKKMWGGVTYRHKASVIGLFGLTIYEDMRLSYAYEFKTSAMAPFGGSVHELVLNYCFKLGVEKSPQKYRSIRYL